MGGQELSVSTGLGVGVAALYFFVGLDAFVVDVLAVWSVPTGDCHFELAAVMDFVICMENPLTETFNTYQVSGFVVM